MLRLSFRVLAGLALVACALGLFFSYVSSTDYAAHLDRGVHDLHCSVIPGASATEDAEPCRAALQSPYAAVLRRHIWGGVPISLAGMGTFAFLLVFALGLFIAGNRATKSYVSVFALLSTIPLLTSGVMLVLSLTQLGSLCKTCSGIYVASVFLAAGAWTLRLKERSHLHRGSNLWAILAAGLVFLGVSTGAPMLVYARSVPDMKERLDDCGSLPAASHLPKEIISWEGTSGHTKVLMVEDPLCPTCNAFNQRLVSEGIEARLDVSLLLFPLDSECNWMLAEPLHPGACQVSRAILCAEDPHAALNWVFDEQESLSEAGKRGKSALRKELEAQFGTKVTSCMDARTTTARLNRHLHFAAENRLPMSTPQLFLGEQRICEEDTDMGLVYTLAQLAPEVLP